MKKRLLLLIPLLTFVFLILSTTLVQPSRVYAAPTTPPSSEPAQLECPDGALHWLVCPVIWGMQQVVNGLDSAINTQMSVGTPGDSSDPNQIFCNSGSTGEARVSCSAYHQAWASMRNIALGLMVIAIIVVLISQALGLEMLDAYTIRKVLPRLLIAALAITLSWQLMQFFVTLSNDLAYGIRYIIYQPFAGLKSAANLGGGGTAVGSLLGISALTALGWFGLLSYVGTALIAAFIAILVLILRQLVIIMLIIVAPIAIAAYILPNTVKLYKFWWESFSKALLMFALISGLIAVGRVFSAVASLNDSTLSQLVAFAAYFLPYFLIPATFKFAGGAISQIGGFVNSRGQGAFGALKSYRANTAKRNWQDLKDGNRLKGEDIPGYGGFARRFNTATRNTANFKNAGYNPMKFRERMRAASSASISTSAREAAEKNPYFQNLLGNDDIMEAALYAAQHGGGEAAVRSILQERGFDKEMVDTSIGAYHHAKQSMGTEAFNTALAVNSFGTSSGWMPKYKKNADGTDYINPATGKREMLRGSGGAGDARKAIDFVSGNDRLRMVSILGQARQQAESKGRFDLVGGSFTQDVLNMERLHSGELGREAAQHGQTAEERLTHLSHRGALDGTSRYRIASGHPRSMTVLAPEMGDEITEQLYGTNKSANWSPEEGVARLAFVANSLDAASNGSPENARMIKKDVLDREIKLSQLDPGTATLLQNQLRNVSGDTVTVGKLMENLRTDPIFSSYRREYNRAEDAYRGGSRPEGEPTPTPPPGSK